MAEPTFKIGIEEEYQIIDPKTRELKSYITQILEQGQLIFGDGLKPELHQSMLEIVTPVCNDITEARSQLTHLRREIIQLASKNNLSILAAGAHPFSNWQTQDITPFERYLGVKKDMQVLAEQLLIFGTHIHIGIEDRDFMIEAMNVMRTFLPLLLCLSTSSPFWLGRDTGLKSYRSIIFRSLPRTGIPRTLRSWGEYKYIVEGLVKVKCIPDGTKIWWDIRPNWNYPTLEIRICDAPTYIDTTLCIAAIIQALIYKLWKMRHEATGFRVYPTTLIDENKWRAVRYGLEGNLIDLGKMEERPAREMICELIEKHIDDVLDELGSRKEVEFAYKILEVGSSADRQLAVYKNTGDFKTVVDQLINETAKGTELEGS
jgi:carboxylate-amine ligase